ncbi:hypothetical protein [Paracoccus sp. ME4]|uniref:hypothetical protein n=1 Tax=Paracoccus sp. ME4 TaxID=3138066 RepID=UPI00398B10DB
MGVAAMKIHDSRGMSVIGYCYPGIAAEFLARLGGDLPGFVPLWRQMRRACGSDDLLRSLFLPDIFSCEIGDARFRMRYTPQARARGYTGDWRTAREIDILIA